MKSRTKNRLSTKQIIRLVEENFGKLCSSECIAELKGGAFNSAYSIRLPGENMRIVLKTSTAPGTTVLSYEKDIMKREIDVYGHIKRFTTLPVPEILCHDSSMKTIPGSYFFMSFAEGIPMDRIIRKIPKDNLIEIKKVLAGYFAEIHEICSGYFGYMTDDQSLRFGSWSKAFTHMFSMILEDGRNFGHRLPYGRIEHCLSENAELLDKITKPRLVDFDLWPGNIFLKQNKDGLYEVASIVDFERAFWGDPFADFPAAVMLLGELKDEPDFWSAYSALAGKSGGLNREDERRMLLYRMYLFTIMVVETYRYNPLHAFLQKTYSAGVIKDCLKRLETRDSAAR